MGVGGREINDLQVPIPETGSRVGKSRLGRGWQLCEGSSELPELSWSKSEDLGHLDSG